MSKVVTDKQKIEDILTRGVENIYPNKKSLEKLLLSGQKIKMYYGIDPTGPSLHFGHLVQLIKLKQFQELGHEIIILIGDFTAQIGDPTDKTATRQQLTHQQVLENSKNYKNQIGRILDIKKANIKFVYNEKWTNKLKPADMIELASYFTVSRLLERDMFQARIKASKEIHLHEFLYPLFQAYDAVSLDVDLQIGGNDQMFNMLAGRTLMKKMKNKEKFVLTTKLLEDPSGAKMGKTEGNMITLEDKPEQMYGKIMSWTDGMILPAFEILTDINEETLEDVKAQLQLKKVNPRDVKMKLAYEVVRVYLGESSAKKGEADFRDIFQDNQKPQDIPEIQIENKDGKIGVLDLFVSAGLAKSNSEVRRLIKEGAIQIDDEKITSDALEINLSAKSILLQRGKRQFTRVVKK
ncbi:MAG TPA: tyrosine--tRNA ligase [Patescibacteria group bacterium]|nr:tyrosine--tRNA ligase [Patescibacteria group bacterium]